MASALAMRFWIDFAESAMADLLISRPVLTSRARLSTKARSCRGAGEVLVNEGEVVAEFFVAGFQRGGIFVDRERGFEGTFGFFEKADGIGSLGHGHHHDFLLGLRDHRLPLAMVEEGETVAGREGEVLAIERSGVGGLVVKVDEELEAILGLEGQFGFGFFEFEGFVVVADAALFAGEGGIFEAFANFLRKIIGGSGGVSGGGVSGDEGVGPLGPRAGALGVVGEGSEDVFIGVEKDGGGKGFDAELLHEFTAGAAFFVG